MAWEIRRAANSYWYAMKGDLYRGQRYSPEFASLASLREWLAVQR